MLLTALEYARLPDDGSRTELERGRLVPMNVPDPRHGEICANVVHLLRLFLDAHPLGRVVILSRTRQVSVAEMVFPNEQSWLFPVLPDFRYPLGNGPTIFPNRGWHGVTKRFFIPDSYFTCARTLHEPRRPLNAVPDVGNYPSQALNVLR